MAEVICPILYSHLAIGDQIDLVNRIEDTGYWEMHPMKRGSLPNDSMGFRQALACLLGLAMIMASIE
jgi:hypothetical protein